MVRIRSEHAIGFLKGRFQSLKGLRVRIKDAHSHRFATYWVLGCIAVHGFAMQDEEDERAAAGDDSDTVAADPFIQEGLSSSSDDDSDNAGRGIRTNFGTRLQAAKARREELKAALLRAKERQAERRVRRRMAN